MSRISIYASAVTDADISPDDVVRILKERAHELRQRFLWCEHARVRDHYRIEKEAELLLHLATNVHVTVDTPLPPVDEMTWTFKKAVIDNLSDLGAHKVVAHRGDGQAVTAAEMIRLIQADNLEARNFLELALTQAILFLPRKAP